MSARNHARVSVVIPTRGRPQLARAAVDSVLRQSVAPHEVVVVIDGPDPLTHRDLSAVADPRVRLVALETSRGAGGARNAGILAATGDLVAFLDDDDTWRPRKLEAQLDAWAACTHPHRTVVACAAHWHTGSGVATWPTRPIGRDERVGAYLFLRDHPGEGVLATPTLMVPRPLALDCPLPTHLRTHEEWDWLLDLEARGAQFVVVPEVLADIDARPRRASVSGGADWRDSLEWALSRRDELGPSAFSGFILTEAARGAYLTGAGPRAQLRLGLVALGGRPRPRDVARFLGRPVALRGRRRGASA